MKVKVRPKKYYKTESGIEEESEMEENESLILLEKESQENKKSDLELKDSTNRVTKWIKIMIL